LRLKSKEKSTKNHSLGKIRKPRTKSVVQRRTERVNWATLMLILQETAHLNKQLEAVITVKQSQQHKQIKKKQFLIMQD
jgi:hypothetical protein